MIENTDKEIAVLEQFQKAPTYTPPKNKAYFRSANPVELVDAFSAYANPDTNNKKPITLIKPPIVFSKNAYSTPITMPIGLAYLAAALDKAAYPVKVIDSPGLDLDCIQLTLDGKFKLQGIDEQESIKMIDPESDIIGISIMFSQEWPYVRKYIEKVRQARPNAIIVIGGEHPTAMPEYTLRDCSAVDYIVTGEGELTFLELVYKLRTKQAVEEIGGIAYIKEGKFVSNGLSPRMANIQKMPWPKWDLFDVHTYFRPNFTMGIGQGRNMAMLATRGCPYQCSFCSNSTMWTTRYTMRAVKDVVDEIQYNIKTYGANSIDFFDLTAIVKKDWILEFMEELKKRQIKVVWQLPSGTRSECIDEEVIKGLAENGCKFLVYAPESGSKHTLAMVKKRIHLDSLVESVKIALKYGIIVKVNFIIGFPFETRKSIWSTLFFVWKLALMKTDDVNIATFTPYPGSELFNELEKEQVFGEINDHYFENLITQFDFTISKSYCRHVSALEIFFCRILGMGIFYVLSYLRVPSRLVRLISSIFKKEDFQPRSLFEQRLFDIAVRKRKPA